MTAVPKLAVPMMQPLIFGPPERRLFGVLHAANEGSKTNPPVLICSPFFQEAISAHRFERVLADRLARNGHAALRFDYFGSRDSSGDDLDLDLEGAARDATVAIVELLRQTGASQCVVIGVRLGGNVAWQASMLMDARVARLLMVCPVIQGPAYLGSLQIDPESSGDRVQDCEAAGFALSARLVSQIRAIALDKQPWLRGPESVGFLAEAPVAGSASVRPAWLPDRIEFVPVAIESNWNSETADGVPLVPPMLLAEVVRQADRT
jgi:pimeloyl-ACP methyl ester carboxylesterase